MNRDFGADSKTPTQMTVAIIGPGAIGTTIAMALHETGLTPILCGRTPREYLEIYDGDKRVQVPGPVQTSPEKVTTTVDLIFLAVKSTQVDAAAPWLAALCGHTTVVCVLQNGIEQKAGVADYVSDNQAIPAVVWFPAQAQPDGSVWLRGKPRLTVPDGTAGRLVADVLRESRCAVELSAEFRSLAWRKLLQNALAGLMVLTSRKSGMFQRFDIAKLSIAYLNECLAVARADGADLPDKVSQEILDAFQGNPPDMGTSILADRQANRALEWDTRNGVILRLGKAHAIPTPISEVVVPLLAASSDGPG
jgi:2-dehydropantoate 2-reductase